MLGNGAGESGLFQSTRPLRGGTFRLGLGTMNCKFQSTRPLRGGTTKFVQMVITSRFQSTRPLRGGTAGHDSAELVTWISIHPPLAGRDPDDVQGQPLFADFNPPAPCGAGQKAGAGKIHRRRFQSTRPLRGGTIWAITSPRAARFQSTRPLRGGTGKDRAPEHFGKISIHPPLAGRDDYSRLLKELEEISIHPPLAGRDPFPVSLFGPIIYFNPPAPCGAGQRSCTKKLCKTSHIAQKVHLPWPY